jgi:hypothetical protein
LLGTGTSLEDFELEQVRDDIYKIVEAMLDAGGYLLSRLDERAG